MPATWYGVVKVQRQLEPVRDGAVLITDRHGSVCYMGPMTPELRAWFHGDDELKFYARAELRNTIIHLKRRVQDRTW